MIPLTRSFIVALVLSTCPAIDPGSCQPHADETPFERGYHIVIASTTLTATAVITDSCTICGKAPQ